MKDKLIPFIINSVPVVMLIAGAALSTYGIGRIHEPASFIWLGLILLVLSWPMGGDE